jgi:transposase
LPQDHLAWLVVEVLESCDLDQVVSSFRRGGVGRQAYDPRMLAALLVYGYTQGVRSSRGIERACTSDVAFMVVAAQQRPDHTTLSRFRAVHGEALAGLFGQVLTVCVAAGMGRVGVVAIDGTKVAADASPKRSHTAKHLRMLAEEIVAEAGQVDAAEDALWCADRTGDELPETLRPGAARAGRIAEALAQAEDEERDRIAKDVAVAERGLVRAQRSQQAREERLANRPSSTGRRQKPLTELKKVEQGRDRVAAAQAKLAEAQAGRGYYAGRNTPRRNITDPDSKLMSDQHKGFVQGFNAQAVVSDDHLIVAFDVSNSASDRTLFAPMMQLAVTNTALFMCGATIGLILADAGYCSVAALTADGPDRLIATGRDPAKRGRNRHIAAMAARLAAGTSTREVYRRRAVTVEPVFGHLKDRIGLRRFSRRGLAAARHEFALAATAHNIRRLATHKTSKTN